MSVGRDERVRFADALMEEAEHSSEMAMRTSLSRAYYALHHLGIAITGVTDHGTIRNRLRDIDQNVGDDYGAFLEWRSKVDYTPSLLTFEPGGIEGFRRTFRDEILRARELFDRMKELV